MSIIMKSDTDRGTRQSVTFSHPLQDDYEPETPPDTPDPAFLAIKKAKDRHNSRRAVRLTNEVSIKTLPLPEADEEEPETPADSEDPAAEDPEFASIKKGKDRPNSRRAVRLTNDMNTLLISFTLFFLLVFRPLAYLYTPCIKCTTIKRGRVLCYQKTFALLCVIPYFFILCFLYFSPFVNACIFLVQPHYIPHLLISY
jgi:hypothetical protein